MGEANVSKFRASTFRRGSWIDKEKNMPKLSTRTVLAVLISLGVIFAIFTSVQGASSSAGKAGSHNVSGSMVNLNHDRFTVSEREAYKAELDAYNNGLKGGGDGHRCESTSPRAHPDY